MLSDIEEPILTVQIDLEQCVFDIRFNDVPLLADPEGLPVNVEIPVNHWAMSGANTLSMKLSPYPDKEQLSPEAKCTLTLFGRQNLAPRETRRQITEMGWPKPGVAGPEEKQSIEISAAEIEPDQPEGRVVLTRDITMPLNLPQWAWLASEEIPEDDETLEALVPEYEKIWKALSEGDAESPVALSATKVAELCAAYYVSQEEMEDELEYRNLVDDEEVSLWDWKPDKVSLEVFGQGRLARLAREDGQSPIVFVCNDGTAAHYLDLIFCKGPEGWTLIR